MNDEKKSPSIIEKGKNLVEYSAKLIEYVKENIGTGEFFVTDEVYRQRYSICKSCDRFSEVRNECEECGCYVPAKAKIILDSCPLKKWDIVHDACAEKFERVFDEMNSEDS